MDRLNALRGTPSPSAAAPSPTTSQKDAAEANDFFAALAGGEDALRALVVECVEGVHSFPMLTDEACDMLVSEVGGSASNGQ